MKKKPNIQKHSDIQKKFPQTSSHLKDFAVFRIIRSLEKEEDDAFYKSVFRSDFFTVIWVISGTVDMSINLKTLHACKGDVLIAAPNAPKQVLNISEDCIFDGLTFTSDFLVRINIPKNHLDMMEYFTSKFNPIWSLTEEEQILCTQLVAALTERTSKLPTHIYGQEILQHSFTVLLYEMAALSRKYATVNEVVFNRKEELMINFVTLSDCHFKEEKNLEFYAKKLFVSTKYLSETVKEISGKTAGEILDELIVLDARMLLSDISLSITDIASQLNFCDRSSFGKFFKRRTGLSPRHYRQTIK